MSDHKEHITQYSAADIQRYVQGKLSAVEMHAMEKAALDDPFLADAIEGMQQALEEHDENLVADELQQLKQTFQTRTAQTNKKATVIAFRWWQAVAAAVIVIISGVWIYSLVTTKEKEPVSSLVVKTEEPKQPQTQQAAPAELSANNRTPVSTDTVTAPEMFVQGTHEKKTTTNRSRAFKSRAKDAVATVAPPPAASNASVVSSQLKKDTTMRSFGFAKQAAKPENMGAADKKEMTTGAAKTQEPAARAAKSDADANKERETELITIDSKAKTSVPVDKNLSGIIKGRVTDLNNNPIAYAYLQVPNNNNNFMTDKTGFFTIPVSDSVVDVSVNVAGYGTQNFRLQNNAALNQLQLQPANIALDEVVVTGLKVKKASAYRKKYPTVMIQDAEPVYGWVAFGQYLEKNKKIPADMAPLTGNVTVSFEVNKEGALSDFKIVQSLAKAYDDEAIRLIQQGPGWKLLKSRKTRITVIVRF